MSHYRRAGDVRRKERGDPVTAADLEADALLREGCARAFPDDGWLSEETADSPERLGRSRVWVVDPLDGTRAFVEEIDEFAVSIALVVEGQARLGVVYNPARDELFAAERGAGGAATPLGVTDRREFEGAVLLASRSERTARLLDEIEPLVRLDPRSSIAYKLALLASGGADLAISLQPKSEWDVCAGTLLVEVAGGVVTDLHGSVLSFNRSDPVIQGLVAANPLLQRRALEWLRARRQSPGPAARPKKI